MSHSYRIKGVRGKKPGRRTRRFRQHQARQRNRREIHQEAGQ